MRIQSWNVTNVMAVSELAVPTAGRHLILVGGRNGQGKTSAVSALLMALCGKQNMDYAAIALKEGADEGSVEVNLEGDGQGGEEKTLKVVLSMKRKRNGSVEEKIEILDASGDPAPEPRTLLRRMFSNRALDPMALGVLKPADQRKMLMALVGLGDSYEAIKRESEKVFAERSGVNRDGVNAKGVYEKMPHHKDVGDVEVDLAAAMQAIEGHQAVNRSVEQKRREMAESAMSVTKMADAIAIIEAKLDVTKKMLADGQLLLATRTTNCVGLEIVDTTAMQQSLLSANETNKLVRDNATRAKAKAELDALRVKSEALTKKLEDLKASQLDAIKAAKWPVDGLAIDDEGLLYKGLPVDQASSAERIKLWCKVSAAMNPSLRVLAIKDGSDLDLDSLKELDAFLVENDFQAIVEFVTRGKSDEDLCCVVLENGKAK